MNTETIAVRGLAQTCWKCHAPSGAVVALHRADNLELGDACWHDDEPVLTLAKELLTGAGQQVVAGQIADRYSRTAGGRYLSNGCHHCSALFGAFFLNEEILALAVEVRSLDAFPELARGSVDGARWAALVDDRTHTLG